MKRSCVVDARGAKRESDVRNGIAEAFWNDIIANLGELILPPTPFGTPFTPNEAPMYVASRTWVSGPKLDTEFSHELDLHLWTWPGASEDYPLIIVLGNEGSGKSTLIRYYFDCYRPKMNQFGNLPNMYQTHLPTPSELDKHLVFYVSIRRGASSAQAFDQLYASLRFQIRVRFPNIAIDDECAMWQRAAHWDEPHHAILERQFPSRLHYRLDRVKGLVDDDARFVVEALWWLGQRRKPGSDHRQFYVTLLIDNLDQQTPDTQRNIMNTVLEWLEPRLYYKRQPTDHAGLHLDLWRVLLPFRPPTYRTLEAILQPLERVHTLRLGEVDQQQLMTKRSEPISRAIAESDLRVEAKIRLDDHAEVFFSLEATTAASRLKHMLIYDATMVSAKGGKGIGLVQGTQDFMNDFCNGSIRRFLKLRRRLISSMTLERAIDRVKKFALWHMPHYLFMDAMLTGDKDYFNAGEATGKILNLYYTTHQEPCAYTLLVGPHVLHLLRDRRCTLNSVMRDLMSIGYIEAEIADCLQAMRVNGLIEDSPPEAPIPKEDRIIKACWALLEDKAYTDNMAMVTPVDPKLRKLMRHTVSYHNSDYKLRAWTTMAFIQQIRDDENVICAGPKDPRRQFEDPSTFASRLASLQLPSVFDLVAKSCHEAMQRVKSHQGALGGYMAQDDWRMLLNDPILKGRDKPILRAIDSAPAPKE